MELAVLVEDGQLALRVGEEDGEPARPVYRGDNRWDIGNTRLTFLLDGDRAFEVRFDTGGGHYVLRRVEG